MVYSVKNNSGSCITSSKDQSVNDILSSSHVHDNCDKNIHISQNTFLKLLLLNCLSCSEIKSSIPYTCKPASQEFKLRN